MATSQAEEQKARHSALLEQITDLTTQREDQLKKLEEENAEMKLEVEQNTTAINNLRNNARGMTAMSKNTRTL